MYAWFRISLFTSCLIFLGLDSAVAQTTGTSPNPRQYLAAPPDPIAYYRDSRRAARLIDDQKWAEAETLLKKVTREYPFSSAYAPNHSNWGELGLALQKQGKHAEAIVAFRRALELQGPGLQYAGPFNVRYMLAVSYTALGQTDAALETLQQLVQGDTYLQRPDLITDENFKSLAENDRFRALAGVRDVAKNDRISGWRGDVDYFVSELRRNNPGNATIPPAFFSNAVKLKSEIPRLTDAEIVARLSGMMATLDRGHTAIWFGAEDTKAGGLHFPRLPVRFYEFPEGIFITEGWNGAQRLAGAQLLRIDGVDALEAAQRATSNQSNESPMQMLWTSGDALVRPGVLEGLHITKAPDRATLTLKFPNGRILTETLRVGDELPNEQWARKLNPPPGVTAPLSLSRPRDNLWIQILPDHEAVFAQMNDIAPTADETVPQFSLRLRKILTETGAKNVILDLRRNNGGNTFQYVELVRTLTAFSTAENHNVFVLIGRANYSAAANLLTDLERFTRPVFVGEPTSMTGNGWGDESAFILPYSGLVGAFAGVRWQLSNPWDQRRSLIPTVPVQLTAKAYFRGEDPAVETVFKMIADQSWRQ